MPDKIYLDEQGNPVKTPVVYLDEQGNPVQQGGGLLDTIKSAAGSADSFVQDLVSGLRHHPKETLQGALQGGKEGLIDYGKGLGEGLLGLAQTVVKGPVIGGQEAGQALAGRMLRQEAPTIKDAYELVTGANPEASFSRQVGQASPGAVLLGMAGKGGAFKRGGSAPPPPEPPPVKMTFGRASKLNFHPEAPPTDLAKTALTQAPEFLGQPGAEAHAENMMLGPQEVSPPTPPSPLEGLLARPHTLEDANLAHVAEASQEPPAPLRQPLYAGADRRSVMRVPNPAEDAVYAKARQQIERQNAQAQAMETLKKAAAMKKLGSLPADPENPDFAQVPFPTMDPQLGQTLPATVDLQKPTLANVKLEDLVATQPTVTRATVAEKLSEGRGPMLKAVPGANRGRPGSEQTPVVFIGPDGQSYLAGGTHRAVAAWARGDKTIQAVVYPQKSGGAASAPLGAPASPALAEAAPASTPVPAPAVSSPSAAPLETAAPAPVPPVAAAPLEPPAAAPTTGFSKTPTTSLAQMVEKYGRDQAAARAGMTPIELDARIAAGGDETKLAQLLRTKIGSEKAARLLGMTKEQVQKLSGGGASQLPDVAVEAIKAKAAQEMAADGKLSPQTQVLMDRIKSERGASPIKTALMAGLPVAGAVGGTLLPAQNGDERLGRGVEGALLGGLGSAAVAAGGPFWSRVGQYGKVLRREGFLTGMAVPKNIIADFPGAMARATVENAGTTRMAPAKELLNLPANLKTFVNSLKQPPVTNPGDVALGRLQPSKIIGAIDDTARGALRRAGVSEADIQRYMLSANRNVFKLGPNETPITQGAQKIVDFAFPFQKIPSNVFYEGWNEIAALPKADARALFNLAQAGGSYALGKWAGNDKKKQLIALTLLAGAGPNTLLSTGAAAMGSGLSRGGIGAGAYGGLSPIPEQGLDIRSFFGVKPAIISAIQRMTK